MDSEKKIQDTTTPMFALRCCGDISKFFYIVNNMEKFKLISNSNSIRRNIPPGGKTLESKYTSSKFEHIPLHDCIGKPNAVAS